jgi:hypothetical protein
VLVWVRISGLALLVAGGLSSLLIPTWGRHIAPASIALIIVGAVTLAAGTRRRHYSDSLSGGVYGDASGLNTDSGGRDHYGGHDGGQGGGVGHGGDSGDGGGH